MSENEQFDETIEGEYLRAKTPADASERSGEASILGVPENEKVLFAASNEAEGWDTMTTALYIDNIGCIVNTTLQQRDADGRMALAHSSVFVERVMIVDDENGGHKLWPIGARR